MTAQDVRFDSLRGLVLHYAAARGWRTQRHIAVMCGLDETALSRFLNGEQDIGARRTHALFQAVGIPVEQYDVAYALLGRAQELAQVARETRPTRRGEPVPVLRVSVRRAPRAGWAVTRSLPDEPPVRWPRHRPPMFPGRAWPDRRPITSPVAPPPAVDEDVPAAVVVALFAARGYSGEQIAAFFADA